jgi:hypothetical protein
MELAKPDLSLIMQCVISQLTKAVERSLVVCTVKKTHVDCCQSYDFFVSKTTKSAGFFIVAAVMVAWPVTITTLRTQAYFVIT